MQRDNLGILQFSEGYFHRIWGGRRLETCYHKPLPEDERIGEAWLIADHPQYMSRVLHGPLAGATLRELMEGPQRDAILGSRAQVTRHGRFPLLLKLLDAQADVSVQVHPDDAKALALNEPDVGKTEMWHVLQAAPGGSLICGMCPDVTPEQFQAAVAENTFSVLLNRFEASEDAVVFVPAGTVHALGKGFVIVEIQQNSDLTYRIHDWGRRDASGKPRELHLDKAMQVTQFDQPHRGPNTPLRYTMNGAEVLVEAACRYFAAELIAPSDAYYGDTHGGSFQLLLGVRGSLELCAAHTSLTLSPGEAAMIPAATRQYAIRGVGACLKYYVPDIHRDVITPLRTAGHADDAIAALGGGPNNNDIAAAMDA